MGNLVMAKAREFCVLREFLQFKIFLFFSDEIQIRYIILKHELRKEFLKMSEQNIYLEIKSLQKRQNFYYVNLIYLPHSGAEKRVCRI